MTLLRHSRSPLGRPPLAPQSAAGAGIAHPEWVATQGHFCARESTCLRMKRHEEMLHAHSRGAAGYLARQLVAYGARVETSRADGKASGEKREVRVEAWRWRMFHICMLLLYCCRGDDTSKSNRMIRVGQYRLSSYRPICQSMSSLY
jgi:hypothetical protein